MIINTTEAMRRFTIFALAACAACVTAPIINQEFDGESAYQLAEAQMTFGARIPGSEAHWATGDWIIETLESSGWRVEEQLFEYQGVLARNIIASLPNQEGEWVLLGAHYDTRPLADRVELDPTAPVPGANDGASGVAVLLELARVLNQDNLSVNVRLVFFDVEDSGGLEGWDWIAGSRYYADHLSEFPRAVVIVDMVGDSDLQLFKEHNSDPTLTAEIWNQAESLGMDGFFQEVKYSILDDHTPFLQRGIPAVDMIDFDYPHWHTTEDTLDKISPDSLRQVGVTLQSWLSTLE
jgi:glutaminyl-peptide cyclotransferase